MTVGYGTSMIVRRSNGEVRVLDFEMADSEQDARYVLDRSPKGPLEDYELVFATIVIEDPRAED